MQGTPGAWGCGFRAGIEEGYKAILLFVIQMKGVKYFTPNYRTHRAFGQALKRAREQGVSLLAVDCTVTKSELNAVEPVEIVLEEDVDLV